MAPKDGPAAAGGRGAPAAARAALMRPSRTLSNLSQLLDAEPPQSPAVGAVFTNSKRGWVCGWEGYKAVSWV